MRRKKAAPPSAVGGLEGQNTKERMELRIREVDKGGGWQWNPPFDGFGWLTAGKLRGRDSFGTVSELAELALLVAQGAGFPSQKHQSGSTG
jgi:hypothetical protein